jgi:PKD repeat protein
MIDRMPMKLKVFLALILLAVGVIAACPAAAASTSAIVQVSACVKIPPIVIFSASNTSGPAPLLVRFTDQSTGVITSWFWDFGDHTTSSQQNPPLHSYISAGTYIANLTLTGPCNAVNFTTKTITVTSSAPVAAFTASVLCNCTGNAIQFTDQSTGTITGWTWGYKNTSTTWKTFSTARNPSFAFSAAGIYDINLTVIGPGGSNTLTKASYITVISKTSPLIPSFTIDKTSGPKPLKVTFTDTSQGACIISKQWLNSTDKKSWKQFFLQPDSSFTFTTIGTYYVRLNATNACGITNSSAVKTISVSCSTVKADMSASPTSVKSGSPVAFTDASSGPWTSWKLDFKDGTSTTTYAKTTQHTYKVSKKTTYSAILTVANDCCTSTKTMSITVSP